MKLNLKKMVGTVVLCGFGTYGMAWAADAEAGKTVYGSKCRICHAADGQGNPAMSKALKTEIKPLTDPEVQGMSEADIKKIVMEGKGKMKPVADHGSRSRQRSRLREKHEEVIGSALVRDAAPG